MTAVSIKIIAALVVFGLLACGVLYVRALRTEIASLSFQLSAAQAYAQRLEQTLLSERIERRLVNARVAELQAEASAAQDAYRILLDAISADAGKEGRDGPVAPVLQDTLDWLRSRK